MTEKRVHATDGRNLLASWVQAARVWRQLPGAMLDTMGDDLRARITLDPAVMGGRPCVRGLRVTVGTIVGLLASGRSKEEVLKAYPYLEGDDIQAALAYAAWRSEEMEVPFEDFGQKAS